RTEAAATRAKRAPSTAPARSEATGCPKSTRRAEAARRPNPGRASSRRRNRNRRTAVVGRQFDLKRAVLVETHDLLFHQRFPVAPVHAQHMVAELRADRLVT